MNYASSCKVKSFRVSVRIQAIVLRFKDVLHPNHDSCLIARLLLVAYFRATCERGGIKGRLRGSTRHGDSEERGRTQETAPGDYDQRGLVVVWDYLGLKFSTRLLEGLLITFPPRSCA